MTKQQEQERDEARARLRELLPPGSTVYTVLRHVSRSGMNRNIDCYAMQDNAPRWISSLVSKATGISFNAKKESLTVGGCGMDMGFAVVYELAYALYPKGFACIGENCPSNDHSNQVDTKQHQAGGYALKQKWM